MVETIDLINALDAEKTSVANNVFNNLMQSKLSTAIDAKKIEVANDVYNGQDISTDEIQGTEAEASAE